MKLYLFEAHPEDMGWDTYSGFVVRAKTRKDAIRIVNDADEQGGSWDKTNCSNLAPKVQGKEGVVLAAFEAG